MGGRKMEVLEYEALKAGMVFGSYKGVCEFLGARIQTGKGKIAQIERWRKQFNWVREGNGWRIVGVHVDVGAEEVSVTTGRNASNPIKEWLKVKNQIELKPKSKLNSLF